MSSAESSSGCVFLSPIIPVKNWPAHWILFLMQIASFCAFFYFFVWFSFDFFVRLASGWENFWVRGNLFILSSLSGGLIFNWSIRNSFRFLLFLLISLFLGFALGRFRAWQWIILSLLIKGHFKLFLTLILGFIRRTRAGSSTVYGGLATTR